MPETPAQHDSDSRPAPLTCLPYDHSLLVAMAEAIMARHHAKLPMLDNIVVLLPDAVCHADMRRALLDAADRYDCGGFLGLHITSLREWIESTQTCDISRIGAHERELILVEALRTHPDLPGANYPWLLADNLLTLFDELNAQHVRLDGDEAGFTRQLRKAYGVEVDNDELVLAHLDREAQLVHRLWQAWHQQLEAQQADDALGIYHRKLHASVNDAQDPHEYWLAGYDQLNAMETTWFEHKSARGRAFMFRHSLQTAEHTPMSDYMAVIRQVYASANHDFAARAGLTGQRCADSPLQQRLRLVRAENEEQEACAVELQVRQWLVQGRHNIGIVTRNRKLARRVRALLERAGISLQDAGGWALSTTSAAAALERWLECIEQEFEHIALLDLLKTPFVFHHAQKKRDADFLRTVYRFEQDIVLHENIASGMHRYQWALSSREQRLKQIWSGKLFSDVRDMLTTLEQAAKPLIPFTRNRPQDPAAFIDSLLASMHALGMHAAMAEDPAGQRVLHELETLQAAAHKQPVRMTWTEMRSWIGKTLERFSFRPDTTDDRVTLLDLQQSQLMQFDAVVLAGADMLHLPGLATQLPFFNDAVRYALGLHTSDEFRQQQFHYYLGVLGQAEEVVITHHLTSSEGDVVQASLWLTALNHFHELAYGRSLDDDSIIRQLAGRHSGIINDSRHTLPMPDSRPAPPTPTQLLPTHLSASSYQQLLDCPYKFFASRLLGLSASEEVSEVLSKTEYGERVHACLEAFHSDVADQPGPFPARLTTTNRDAAIALLEEIAAHVFSSDIRDNFEHRGWLKRFVSLVPEYVDWQIQREAQWTIRQAEVNIEREHPQVGIALKGRLDRIDANADGLSIIDYKTGYTPTQADVDAGEAVQLPFYALLSKEVVGKVEYLGLEQNRTGTRASLAGEQLDELVKQNIQRLASIVSLLHEQQPLPAWGDEHSCSYCDMSGLCRRPTWENGEAGS